MVILTCKLLHKFRNYWKKVGVAVRWSDVYMIKTKVRPNQSIKCQQINAFRDADMSSQPAEAWNQASQWERKAI